MSSGSIFEDGEKLLTPRAFDFVLDSDGRLVFAHRSAEPTDRPTVERLLRAVREADAATG